jgi:hypothetical protein
VVLGQGCGVQVGLRDRQLRAAAAGAFLPTCPHYAYAKGITGTAGQFLASRA